MKRLPPVALRLAGLVALACLCACSTLDITVQSSAAWSEKERRTFTWAGSAMDDTPSGAMVKTTVVRELTERGYEEVSQRADLVVLMSGGLAGSMTSRSVVWEWNGPREALEATLGLTLQEPSTKDVLWRVTAATTVPASLTPDERVELLRDVLADLLAEVPAAKD